jgi:hypothetical protein
MSKLQSRKFWIVILSIAALLYNPEIGGSLATIVLAYISGNTAIRVMGKGKKDE